MASTITWREVAAHYQEIMNGLSQANAQLQARLDETAREFARLQHDYENLKRAHVDALRDALTTPETDLPQDLADEVLEEPWPAPHERETVTWTSGTVLPADGGEPVHVDLTQQPERISQHESVRRVLSKILEHPEVDRDQPVTYGWGDRTDEEFETTTVGELLDRHGFVDWSQDGETEPPDEVETEPTGERNEPASTEGGPL